MQAENIFLRCCNELSKVKPVFAELLLPLAFADLAIQGGGTNHSELRTDICEPISHAITKGLLPSCPDHPKAMSLLLKCLAYLRKLRVHAISHKARVGSNMLNGMLHLTESAALSWRSVYWFTIDYILLADAAVKCRAFFSALLYIEVWCEEAGHGFPHSPLQALGQCNSSSNAPVIEKVRRLLLEIYSNIEEPDSLYAVADGLDLHSQLKRFEREGKWDQALVTYDVGLQSHCFVSSDQLEMMTEKEATDGILRCLNNLGMNTVHNYMLNAMRQQSFMNDSTTHHALSLSEWRPLQPQKKRDSSVHGAQINGDLALALAALKTGDSDACYQAVVSCRQSLVYSLGTEGQESSSDVNPALVQLQLVHLMSEGWNFAYPRLSNFAGSANLHKVGHSMLNREEYKRQFDESWQYYLQNVWGRYNLLFPIQDLRREILHNCGEYDEEAACLTDMIKLARKAGRVGQALGYLGRLKSLVGHCKDSSPAIATWNIESAKLSWAREERTQAVHHLKSFVFNYRGSCTDQQERNELMTYADVLVAKWMGISQTGKPDEILNALKRARHRVEFSTGDTKPYNPVLGCRIVYRLAQYADLLYRNLDEKMSSSDWKAMVHVIRKNTSDYKRLSAESGSEHFRNTIGQRLAEDIQEYNKANERITELRLIAISNYGYCMRIGGNKYDLQCAFRLVQFWLDNGENDKIVECVDSQLKQIPSYKFLPLINQIASRIASSDQHTAFQNSLRRLLIRMCGEHPFHTVVKLIALKNGNLDLEGNGKLTYHADEGRMEAARCVLEEVEVSNMYLRTILSQLTRAVDVFIALADIPVNKEQSKMRFPLNLKKELLSLEHIPVLSLSLPVDPSMKYDGNQMTDVSMPRVVSIMDVITIPGGVNKPKKVTLTTTQGKEVSLLVKKEKFEDIRQDAIMQQFFRTVNSLLADSLETRSRNLRIRTYNVVPLKPRCGLVEWVDNTRPLMSIIDDEAYRKDVASTVKGSRKYSASVPQLGLMSFDTAYSRFSKTDKESITKKREIFDTIVARLRPVLHAFFLANYQDPGSWFKARLTYTRSTAVASIAGHIVGLGDRHNSNILLDTSTAEVVHIDLGIAFEQGKYLPIPERVPFRLTSNVKDGMGVNGVNGVMKKCSEQTLLVLRSNKDALLTVLGVVIHDPLYKWGLTLVQANRRQGKETYGETANADALIGNADADRTLLRIKHKLEGLETGTGSSAPRSVEGQVDYLIEEARNPDNLCRMYIGWRPYF